MFKINGETWRILLVEPFDSVLQRSDGTWSIGSCDDLNKIICLDHTLPDPLIKKVLAHEITHAAMFSYNIDLDYEQEEMLADIISRYGQEIISITNRMFNSMI